MAGLMPISDSEVMSLLHRMLAPPLEKYRSQLVGLQLVVIDEFGSRQMLPEGVNPAPVSSGYLIDGETADTRGPVVSAILFTNAGGLAELQFYSADLQPIARELKADDFRLGPPSVSRTGTSYRSGFAIVHDSKQHVQNTFGLAPTALVVYIRGGKAQSVATALDQFAAAFQFPWYFGDNLDAFWDCMCDLSWLWPFTRISLVIFDANLFLSQERPVVAKKFIDLLSDVIQYWSADAGDAGRTSSQPIAMDVLLQVEPENYWEGALKHLGV
jgi:RNAse (barnase) inhibitor barstar